MNDLATLLRADVTASEPTHGLDAMVPVRLGRRRLRTRRLLTGAAAAVVVAVGAAVAVPLVTDDGSSRGVEPTGQGDEVDRVVATVADHLLPDGADVGPAELADDAFLITFRDGEHAWSASVSWAGEPPMGFEENCQEDVYLACDVVTEPDGTQVQTRLTAVVPRPAPEGGTMWVLVPPDDARGRADLHYERSAKADRGDGVFAYASERLPATSQERAERAFTTPVADLVACAADPDVDDPDRL